MSSLQGQTIANRFVLDRLIGRGAMGEVYEAEQLSTGRRCAIKVLRAELVKDDNTLARFEREARIASRLNHPHTITIYDSGRDGDVVFIAMELLEGESLADVLRLGRLTQRRALAIATAIAESLGDAHRLGIVHRDLKPENVILVERAGNRDFVKVCDFGIARMYGGEQLTTLTTDGMVYGTPHYMSPEQLRGESLDGRSDIYALGVLLYEMLAGRRPFIADSPIEMASKHLVEEPPLFASLGVDLGVPAELEEIVQRALTKRADGRWQNMDSLREALHSLGPAGSGAVPLPGERSGEVALDPAVEVRKEASTLESAATPIPSDHVVAAQRAGGTDAATAERRRQGRFAGWMVASLLLLVGVGVFGTTGILLSVRGAGDTGSVLPEALDDVLEDRKTDRDDSRSSKSSSEEDDDSEESEDSKSEDPKSEDEDGSKAARADEHDSDSDEAGAVKADGTRGDAKPKPKPDRAEPPVARSKKADRAPATAATKKAPPAETGETGTLVLNAVPWARVFLGKRELGTTPLRALPLPPGKHRLLLKNDSLGTTRHVDVNIEAGKTRRHPLIDMRPTAH